MTTRVLGTCGNCGGTVVTETAFLGMYPPKPHCTQCNAIPRGAGLPVIAMEGTEDDDPMPFVPVREITEEVGAEGLADFSRLYTRRRDQARGDGNQCELYHRR